MGVELWIKDGDPWYLSPNIWVVPGDDPTGPAGAPTAGWPCHIWARVSNEGDAAVIGATVRYYYGHTAPLLRRSDATLVGTSFVSIEAHESREVLCVTPWSPPWINDGHECLVVEAYSVEDPLPPSTELGDFQVQQNRQIAQLNLTVLQVDAARTYFAIPFFVRSPLDPKFSKWKLSVERTPISKLKMLEKQIGNNMPKNEMTEETSFGILPHRPGIRSPDLVGKKHIDCNRESIGPGMAFLLSGRLEKCETGTGALFLIEERAGKSVLGGIAVIVIAKRHKGG